MTLSPRFYRSFKDTGDKGDIQDLPFADEVCKSEGTAQGHRASQLQERRECSKRVTLTLLVSLLFSC